MHVAHAREQIGSRTIPVVIFPQLPELMSIISWSEYVTNCTKISPPSSWVSDVVENLLRLTLTLSQRFPNPIPTGTRVPQWALLDVTVRRYNFFSANVLTARLGLRTIGTSINRMLSAVRKIPRPL